MLKYYESNGIIGVAKYPDRNRDGSGTRGYYISQLNTVWKTIDSLKQDELQSASKQAFYNYSLGNPYLDTKLAVTEDDILEHTYEQKEPKHNREGYEFISAGIDWGNTHWLTVYGLKPNGQIDLLNLAAIEKPSSTDPRAIGKDIEQIKLFLAPYKPDIIVADIGDSGDKIAQLIKYYGEHMVFGCQYNSSPRSSGRINSTWSDTGNTVKADKLTENKKAITMLKEGRISHFDDPENRLLKLLVYHWQNVVIREEEDEKTGEFYQIITAKNNGEDHFSQSTVYGILGLERLQELYKSGTGYEFNSGFVTSDPTPTRPDIFEQYSGNDMF